VCDKKLSYGVKRCEDQQFLEVGSGMPKGSNVASRVNNIIKHFGCRTLLGSGKLSSDIYFPTFAMFHYVCFELPPNAVDFIIAVVNNFEELLHAVDKQMIEGKEFLMVLVR
jgi:hypothetical protein